MLKYADKETKKRSKQEMNVLEKLGEKIDELLNRVNALKEENETLRQDLVNTKAQCEIKTAEIQRLQELNAQKEREIEEIVNKIESMIG